MASNDYHFITRWRVEATIEKAYRLISNAPDLPRWWPSVYLEVRVLSPGDETGVGKVVDLYTRGWLPYTLRWQIRADKPLLRHLSFVLRPIFSANHRWAMAQGEKSLCAELARRAALTK
ncbi:MAG: hypothetical protein ACREPG_10800 [Candidatus Binatia bacterium]